MSDQSTAVLQGQLERALTGDAEARQRLLALTRDYPSTVAALEAGIILGALED